jgi:hypothetical protein
LERFFYFPKSIIEYTFWYLFLHHKKASHPSKYHHPGTFVHRASSVNYNIFPFTTESNPFTTKNIPEMQEAINWSLVAIPGQVLLSNPQFP